MVKRKKPIELLWIMLSKRLGRNKLRKRPILKKQIVLKNKRNKKIPEVKQKKMNSKMLSIEINVISKFKYFIENYYL